MTTRALGLAKSVVSQYLPKNSKILDKGFISPSDASSFGFTNPKNIEFANGLFTQLNSKEKTLQEKKESLQKSLGPNVPWSYFQNHINDEKAVAEAKSLYESIFINNTRVPALQVSAEGEKPTAMTLAGDRPELIGLLQKRIDSLRSEIETDVNPFLNPYTDFWVYEMDGPEFAEIFAARPTWQQHINEASEQFAFTYTKQDPLLSSDLQETWNAQIASSLEKFVPVEEDVDLMAAIAEGKISQQLLVHYDTKSLAVSAAQELHEWTHEDTPGLALRNAFVSPEVDPQGKHFHH